MLTLEQALEIVKSRLAAAPIQRAIELVPLGEAKGRVLAEDIAADRDYPPFNRATRDGFAVRADDLAVPPSELRLRGEIPAGGHFAGRVDPGECVAIMTGAPLPAGADAVVMFEYTESHGDSVRIQRAVRRGENVVAQGSEVRAGAGVLGRGSRLGAAELGLLASVGRSSVPVYARPNVAILPTGDELVPVEQRPEWFQIRNSNSVSLAAQVSATGGIPRCLEVARDQLDALRLQIQRGLDADLLLLSGGVSAGRYDFVEPVLADLGAEFYFQSVALRPGKPLVFGRAAGKFFFGLPGNPISTFVTFALLVRPAIAVLGGADFAAPLVLQARLGGTVRGPAGLTAFVPARLEQTAEGPLVRPVPWQGSGDLVGVAAAQCFNVIRPERLSLTAGDWVEVMMKEQ